MSRETPFQRDLASPIEERRFHVGAPDDGRRLDVFLAERMAWRSRARIKQLIVGGRVEIEPALGEQSRAVTRSRPDRGEQTMARASTRLRRGDEIVVRLDSAFIDAARRESETTIRRLDRGDQVRDGSAAAIEVIYEDDHLLAVNKPPRMNVYPTHRHLGGSLTELVHRRHRALVATGLVPGSASPPSPCHRLDRETSGVVLYARDRATRADIGRQFQERTVEKTYLALVAGVPAEDEGVIDLPLGRDLGSPVEIKQGPRCDGGGVAARTRWAIKGRFENDRRRSALLELHPETGRQHQLRAHLAAIGHPILGDVLYLGGDDLFLASLERELDAGELARLGGSDRLALHAWRLAIHHPGIGSRLELAAPTVGLEAWWDVETR